jgi:hypothetical protein
MKLLRDDRRSPLPPERGAVIKKQIDIITAIRNPKLFRPLFADLDTWGGGLFS